MEESRGARRVTQRSLEPPDTDRLDPAPAESTPPVRPAAPAGPPAEILREPSDRALRERQRVWWRERARFEASRRGDRTDEPASK